MKSFFLKKIVLFIPFIILIVISIFYLIFLISNKDPNKPPSALLDENLPNLKLTSLFDENKNLQLQDTKGKMLVVNFFASWCIPCKKEHPLLIEIKNNYPEAMLIGINHKDKEKDAKEFLNNYGNPYNFVGLDNEGEIGFEFGVFGLPETFIINKENKIIYKITGPLSKQIIKNEISPIF